MILRLTPAEVIALDYALTEGISNAEYDGQDTTVELLKRIERKMANENPSNLR